MGGGESGNVLGRDGRPGGGKVGGKRIKGRLSRGDEEPKKVLPLEKKLLVRGKRRKNRRPTKGGANNSGENNPPRGGKRIGNKSKHRELDSTTRE